MRPSSRAGWAEAETVVDAFQPSGARYRDPRLTARFAIGGLLASAVYTGIAATVIAARLVADVPFTITITGPTMELPAGLQAFQRISPVVSLVTHTTWLVWQYRGHTDARVIAAETAPTSPAWGVLCWFVPFLNFVKPFQVVREIQHASVPRGHAHVALGHVALVGVLDRGVLGCRGRGLEVRTRCV